MVDACAHVSEQIAVVSIVFAMFALVKTEKVRAEEVLGWSVSCAVLGMMCMDDDDDDDDDDEDEEEEEEEEGKTTAASREERIAEKNAGRLLERIHFERTKALRGPNKSTRRSIVLTHESSKRSDSFNSLMEENTEHLQDKDGKRIIITAHVAQWNDASIELRENEPPMSMEAFFNIKRRTMLYADDTNLRKSHPKKTISRPLSPINGGESMR